MKNLYPRSKQFKRNNENSIMKKNSIINFYTDLNLKSVSNKVEFENITHTIQSRKDTPIESYIELDVMLVRVDRERKKVK